MRLKPAKNRWFGVAIFGVSLLLASSCGSSDQSNSSTGNEQPSSGSTSDQSEDSPPPEGGDKPFAGTKITYQTFSAMPEFDFYKTMIPKFTEETGIEVDVQQLPVSSMDTTLALQLKSKDSSVDVFSYGTESITSFVSAGNVVPLDAMIEDSSLTSADYDLGDVSPKIQAACQVDGVNYCVASHAGGGLLYYNKAMFDEAGLTQPPNNPAELLEYAQKLTTSDHAGFCVRADKSQALYDAFQMWNWFVPYANDLTGTYFDENWQFLLGTEPQASEFGDFYRSILQTAAPKGIATYMVDNCLQDFQQGRVAMWQDAADSIPQVLDPDQSAVADDVEFWEMPCQEINPDNCSLVQPFGVWINAASQHQQAAWQLVQYLTSVSVQKQATTEMALLTPSRTSIINDAEATASFPTSFAEAYSYILEHPDAVLLPNIPEGVSLIEPIASGLSELITSTDSVETVMARMKSGVDAIMKDAGYPK